MPPRKVMKTVMKKSLEKPSPSKPGKAKLGKAAKAKAKAKAKLTKNSLEKLGTLSLQDKVQAAANESEDPDAAALALQGSLSKLEKSKLWSKHQIALKRGSQEERDAYNNLSKREKGLAAAAYFLEKEGKQWLAATKSVVVAEKLKQLEVWESELQMLGKWSEKELEAHIASGRISWRECPGTRDVYEYSDNHNFQKEKTHHRKKEFQSGVESDPLEEDLEKFFCLFEDGEWSNMLLDENSKGLGKSGKGLGKGSGKGKALGKGQQGSASSKGVQEEDDLGKVLKACRTARNVVIAQQADLEEALEKAKSQLSKPGKASASSLLKQLGKAVGQLKGCLSATDPKVDKLKGILMEVAKVIKAARDEAKELKHLGNKAASTTSKKK